MLTTVVDARGNSGNRVLKGNDETRQKATIALEIQLRRVAEEYSLSITNKSHEEILLPQIYLRDGYVTGYWLFLFDPKSKNIQEAWSTDFGAERRTYDSWPKKKVKPGGSLVMSFEERRLLDLFVTTKEHCYLLVAVYRKFANGRLAYAPPSSPVPICDE